MDRQGKLRYTFPEQKLWGISFADGRFVLATGQNSFEAARKVRADYPDAKFAGYEFKGIAGIEQNLNPYWLMRCHNICVPSEPAALGDNNCNHQNCWRKVPCGAPERPGFPNYCFDTECEHTVLCGLCGYEIKPD